MKNKLMILAAIAIAVFQTSCVKPGHNYVDDGLPLDGTVWKAQWNSTSVNGGPLSEEWILYFEAGSIMRQHYKATDDIETVTSDKIGSYQYKSPEGQYSLDNYQAKFLVNKKELYVNGSPLTYHCIKGRD